MMAHDALCKNCAADVEGSLLCTFVRSSYMHTRSFPWEECVDEVVPVRDGEGRTAICPVPAEGLALSRDEKQETVNKPMQCILS